MRCGNTELSYGELLRGAQAIAAHLGARHVGPERLVGICLTRSPQLPMALLACLMAGGAYVPLDPAYPRERLEAIASDSDMTVLLSERPWLLAGSRGFRCVST